MTIKRDNKYHIFAYTPCFIYLSANKMDTNNMAIVMGPNIVVNNPDKSTDYSIVLTEMEMTQRLVEMLIIHVKEVFEEQF